MRIRRIIDDLAGRSHHRAIGMLLGQLDAALDGVELTAEMISGGLSPAASRAAMVDVEHAGDAQRAALVVELGTALTTPIDREDLYRLSRSVDDVLDNLRDLVRETDLYDATPQPADLAALTAVAEGLRALRDSVRALGHSPAEVLRGTLAARKRAGRVRQLHQTGMAELFRTELSMATLSRRELLRRIDVVGQRLGECADALSDAMLKRSH